MFVASSSGARRCREHHPTSSANPWIAPLFFLVAGYRIRIGQSAVSPLSSQIRMAANDSLPTERDFDPWSGNLDAQCAWRNFGGLTLDEAHARFRTNPLYYQEDFMFMGGRAFAYYFPVIENFLRAAPDTDYGDDHQSWILAHCIRQQFEGDNLPHVRHLVARVMELARFVRDNVHRFEADALERQRVTDAWNELVRHVEAANRS